MLQDFCCQVKAPETSPGPPLRVRSSGVVAPGDTALSVSSARLWCAGLAASPSCVLQKFLGAMFLLSVLIMGVSTFAVQSEEHLGK